MQLTTMMKILLLITLISCKNPKFDIEIRRVWSMEFNTCFCSFYDLNEVKNLTRSVPCEEFFMEHFPEVPVMDNRTYCETVIGFTPEALATRIIPKAKEIKRYFEDKKSWRKRR